MWFHHIIQIRPGVFDDLAGKEHPTGLTSDHSCSNHVVAYIEIIFRFKVFTDHLPHFLITGHHNPAHLVAGIRYIHPGFMHLPCQVEKPVPGVCALLTARPLLPVHHLVEPARANPIQQRFERTVLRIIQMRQEHSLRFPVPHLFRAHINGFSLRIDIQEKLGRILDFCCRSQRVPAPDQRKESDCIQLEQEWAGHAEKIAHHKIRSPGCGQFGKTVEDIERVKAFLCNQVMNGHRKCLEPVRQFNMYRFDLRMSFCDGWMGGKSDIDDIAVVFYRLFQIRVNEQVNFIKTGYAPYDIIPQPDIIKSLIHFRNPGQNSFKRCHFGLLF